MSDKSRKNNASGSVGPGKTPGRAELEHLLTRIIERINASPDKAAIILTEWTRQGSIQAETADRKRKAG